MSMENLTLMTLMKMKMRSFLMMTRWMWNRLHPAFPSLHQPNRPSRGNAADPPRTHPRLLLPSLSPKPPQVTYALLHIKINHSESPLPRFNKSILSASSSCCHYPGGRWKHRGHWEHHREEGAWGCWCNCSCPASGGGSGGCWGWCRNSAANGPWSCT